MNIVKELCKITEDKYDSVKNVTRLGKKTGGKRQIKANESNI